MKIAVIADIHGNIPAFEAVLRDIEARGADRVICLGDMVGKGPNSRAAIDLCRRHCDEIVIGNWEHVLFHYYVRLCQGDAHDITERMCWFIDEIGDERMEFAAALPHSTEFTLGGKLVRLFHAHPQNFNRYFPDSPLEQRAELFGYSEKSREKRESDIAVYADIHRPYDQTLSGRRLINVGSVGNPLDVPRASYAVIEDDGGDADVQFVRVDYDIDRAVELARRHDTPDLDGYIAELRNAEYFRRR
ncbi:MAG: metallophosphoesterase family protein [Oscillospiraceae bacterium]|jgi:predicted phosphodiesterase|nr:metallophosphoesterase family protein [Oscillospiraceae bacterium]